MQDMGCKMSRIAAVVVILLAACVGSGWAATGFQGGIPWQAGDIIVCFGTGTCNVLRIVAGSPVLLDQFSDLGSVTPSGTTSGTSINNTLHLLVTDAGTGGSSNIVVYTIASLDASLNKIPHTPLHVFDGSVVDHSTNIQAIAQDLHGNIFAGNASPATIVKLDQFGNGISAFPIPSGAFSAWQGSTAYTNQTILDPNERLQKVATAGTSGPNIPTFNDALGQTLDGLSWKDLGKPGWNANTTYAVGPAPAGTFVVDNTPQHNLQTVTTAGTSGPNQPGVAPNPVSWATGGGTTIDGLQWQDQGAWAASTPFAVGALAGDAGGHVHTALTAGTSGGGAVPTGITGFSGWNDTNHTNGGITAAGVTIDNAVIWTNEGPFSAYGAGAQYALNAYTAANGHIQQAVEPGTSGDTAPNFSTSGGRTVDNAVTWADLGPAAWLASFNYGLNAIIVDGAGHVQQVTTAGTAGPTAPAFVDGVSPGGTVTDGLQWQSTGTPCGGACPFSPWAPNTAYGVGSSIVDTTNNAVVWNAISAGTSGTAANRPAFEGNDAQNTILVDNAVVWTDQGPLTGSTVFNWQANNPYAVNAQIVDGNNHVQLVSIAGTSGPAQPTFQDGGTANDNNSVTWTNLGMAVWRASFSYGFNAIIVDPAGNVQQATVAGTTGASQPTFNANQGMTTSDGSITWTNKGPLSGNTSFTWQPSTPYNLNAIIVDAANQIELATAPGTSSGGSAPAFADGGNVVDGLVWLDLGPVLTWTANATYTATVAAPFTLVIGNGFVQQATTTGNAGTPSQPSWNATVGGKTVDGLQWTDQEQSVWQPGHLYSIGDPLISEGVFPYTAEKVYESGTSGAGPNPPTFNHSIGGLTQDNAVKWTESHPNWQANNQYFTKGVIVLDGISNVQQVATLGTSAPSGVQPASGWNETTGGITYDNAVFWQDNNFATFGTPCITNQLNSLDLDATGNVIYFSSSPGGVVQQVANLSNCTVVADFGPNVALHAMREVPPQSMPATCKGSACPNTNGGILVVANGTIDIDAAGTSDPDETTGEAPLDICTNLAPTGNPSSCALLLDAADGHIVARYPVSSATSNLQALTLDPFVTNCTGTTCAASWVANTSYALNATVLDPAMHVQKVTTAGTSGGTAPAWNETITGTTNDGSVVWKDVSGPSLANFWVGESATSNLYEVNFATGGVTGPFDGNGNANTVCGANCASVGSVQALGIYTGKGANQAAQAKVFSGNISSATAGTPGTAASQFLSNKLNVSVYPASNATLPSTPIALYGSVVDESTCYDDTQNFPCTPTTYVQGSNTIVNPNAAIVWKIDVPLPSSGMTTLPGDSISSKLSAPGIGTDTDFFRDASIDDTIQVGNIDPMKCCTSSSGEAHLITKAGTAEQDFGCTIISPIAKCFKSQSNVTIKMQCTSYPGGTGQFGVSSQTPWGPRLQIMQQPHPAKNASGTCFGVAPNALNANALGGSPAAFINPSECSQNQLISNSNSYVTARFDATTQNWVFNWHVPSNANNTYTATFYDDTNGLATGTNHLASKPVVSGAFVIAPTCP